MYKRVVGSIKSQCAHQYRLLPALSLDLLEETPCLLSLEGQLSPEKKSLMFFHVSPENTPSPIYIFMIATAPIDKTYPSPSEPILHAQPLMSRI